MKYKNEKRKEDGASIPLKPDGCGRGVHAIFMNENLKKKLPALIMIAALAVFAVVAGVKSGRKQNAGTAWTLTETASADLSDSGTYTYSPDDASASYNADDNGSNNQSSSAERKASVNSSIKGQYGTENTAQTINLARTSRAYAMKDNYIQWDEYELDSGDGLPEQGFGYNNDSVVVNQNINTVTLPEDITSSYYDSLRQFAFGGYDNTSFAEIIDDANTAHTVRFISSAMVNSDQDASQMQLSTLINSFNDASDSYGAENLKNLSGTDNVYVMRCQNPNSAGSWLYMVAEETATSKASTSDSAGAEG